MPSSLSFPPSTDTPVLEFLHIERWSDPLIDRLGHDPRSRYVERFWLGILGPSTTLLLRLCADALDDAPGGVQLELTEVAAQLGLGHKGGRNSPLARSILRACRFGAARAAGKNTLEVRTRLAPLNRGQVERLSRELQSTHSVINDRHRQSSDPELRARARRLALSLIECGDVFDETERQLEHWRVPATVASEAVNWAWERHAGVASFGPA